MITSKHLVIVVYIIEMCCVCVGIFSITGLKGIKKQVQKACRNLSVLLLIRLIVKMIYFYVEYYVRTWPLDFVINTAMDTTYVLSILQCLSIVEEITEVHFPKQKLFLILSAAVYVAGFEIVSFFWIDPASNVEIMVEDGFPRMLYCFNEIFFLGMAVLLGIQYFRVLEKCRKEEDAAKRKIFHGCRWILLNNFWYSLYVFVWNISFFVSWGKRFRSLKPLDGVLFFILFLIVIYIYIMAMLRRLEAGSLGMDGERKPDFSAESWESRLSDFSQKYMLTKRETEILRLLIHGDTYQEMSEKLVISVNTVKRHCSNIYQKCDVKNRNQIFAMLNFKEEQSLEKIIRKP